MGTKFQFNEVLEAVEKMSLEEHESLVEILERRRIERRRAQIARDVRAARREFKAGKLDPATPDQIMESILP
jgi:hypothetical protein